MTGPRPPSRYVAKPGLGPGCARPPQAGAPCTVPQLPLWMATCCVCKCGWNPEALMCGASITQQGPESPNSMGCAMGPAVSPK